MRKVTPFSQILSHMIYTYPSSVPIPLPKFHTTLDKSGNEVRKGRKENQQYSTHPEVDISLVFIATKNGSVRCITHTFHSHAVQHIARMTTTDIKGEGVCTTL